MVKTIGIGKQDFASVIEDNCFFVDKTSFIKEWWDSKGHGTVELMDFVFTAMGAASGACVSVPVMMLLRLFIQL